ncbi:MAG: TonB-dependent receptor [Bacteroidota bacterium]
MAQTLEHTKNEARIIHEISGVILDSTEIPIANAVINLTSTKDTLKVITNTNGIFILKNVLSTEFLITISSFGYIPLAKRYFFNPSTITIILDPIILGTETKKLKEVVINGTSRIVYKTDTTEYRAADYKVMENATVDELLKKMEGVTLGRDKSLFYLGQPVSTLKINGKRFGDGNVSQMIQILPAEIVEKAQFIDDYGEEAERTGIKNGEPSKILNLTTQADKSIANIARATVGAGSKARNDSRLFLQRINANQQIGLTGNLEHVLNGVASNQATLIGTPGANVGSEDSGGNTTNQKSTINYRDQWGKYLQVNSFYTYGFNNINSSNLSNGNLFSSNGTTNFSTSNGKLSRIQNHKYSFDLDYTPDSANFFKFSHSYNTLISKSNSNLQQTFNGYQNQTLTSEIASKNTKPTISLQLFYQHLFKKKSRNISFQFTFSENYQNDLNENTNNIIYKDDAQVFLKDSLQHFLTNRNDRLQNYKSSFTYIEPMSISSQLEFNIQLKTRTNKSNILQDSINTFGQAIPVPLFTNTYQYTFAESILSLNYRLIKKKHNLSIGIAAVPTYLKGNQNNLAIENNNFNLLPIFRYEYIFSRTERASINYSGTAIAPSPTQLQPIVDRTDPQNIVVGNPYLKPTFYQIANLEYNNFLANSKMNISLNGTVKLIKNKVITNVNQVPLLNVPGFYNEYRYLNSNGDRSFTINHAIAKQLASGKLSLEANGFVSYASDRSASNNIVYISNSWFVRESLGISLNPNESLEINPYTSYSSQKRSFNQPNAINNHIITTSINLDGKIFLGSWKIGYEASKNFIRGIDFNINKNPYIFNTYIEKALLPHNNGLLRVQLFDLFKQNNQINQVVSAFGTTNTKSNTLSRYGFLSFTYTVQKWSGAPKKNGENRKRRGDGSFIY